MAIELDLVKSAPAGAEALGVGAFATAKGPALDGDVDGAVDRAYLVSQGFEAKPGEVRTLPGANGGVVTVVGLGARAEATAATYRRAGATLARAWSRQRSAATTLLDDLPDGVDAADAAQALAEGLLLGAYRFTAYKADPKPSVLSRVAVTGGGRRVATALERGRVVAGAVCVARDLVNEPGGTLTPVVFAERAAALCESSGVGLRILDEKAIRKERLGGLLGVNRGSEQPPRFLELTWVPEGARATLALVGKGVTFDSGGLSLKAGDAMVGMKGDMGGAAAVLAAMSVAPSVAPRTAARGYLPLTDNMTGGDATRVGDVLRIRNGKTVEVLNTDAEGRLILADALSVASEAKPDAIVDLATLTGACMIALGERTAGLMGNHRGLVDQVRAAADRAGEDVWPLPLPDHLRSTLDSEVADLRNIATTRYGGALVAGVFLREFVADGVPWAHLDIAGPSDSSDDDGGERRKGATGFGVRTLVELLATFRKPRRADR
jgi:leucyl aminopeptidase